MPTVHTVSQSLALRSRTEDPEKTDAEISCLFLLLTNEQNDSIYGRR